LLPVRAVSSISRPRFASEKRLTPLRPGGRPCPPLAQNLRAAADGSVAVNALFNPPLLRQT